MVVKVVCLILKGKDSQDPQEERSSRAANGKILKRKEPQEERSSRDFFFKQVLPLDVLSS